MSSAWKVAYADFVTALMAFFLLMWILNMVPPETKQGLAEYFSEEATLQPKSASPALPGSLGSGMGGVVLQGGSGPGLIQSQQAVSQKLQSMILTDDVPRNASNLSSDDMGVLLRVNNSVLFDAGSAELTDAGRTMLDGVMDILREYNVYLVVRGHADTEEAVDSPYASAWELSAARAAAAVHYLAEHGIMPTRLRAVAYADTRPVQPGTSEASLSRNRRVELYFHRPEASVSRLEY